MSDECAPLIKEQTIHLASGSDHAITLRGQSKEMYCAEDGAVVFAEFKGEIVIEACDGEFYQQLMRYKGTKNQTKVLFSRVKEEEEAPVKKGILKNDLSKTTPAKKSLASVATPKKSVNSSSNFKTPEPRKATPPRTPIDLVDDESEVEEDYGLSQDANFLNDSTFNELIENMHEFNVRSPYEYGSPTSPNSLFSLAW
eukprot:CAMPEP_0172459348 /NCGR_PEP_ID=MMETSP1065-20121228/32216_1 /TAXON_ID=265537 /ORGANISM="Amphiprora paludosa, Strain CCMP125" /LENGTH=197 /DNA_ID=CAMNT_0013214001 /DNA_START=684 /DNA_END=1274 /DNA_ORIENTATION=+